MPEALPTIESTGGRAFWFEAADGARLRGAVWETPSGKPRGTALLLGGRTEFIEKNLEATEELLMRGFAVWSFDWRGQGLSARALEDRHKGQIEDYRQFLDDLALFMERFVLPASSPPIVVLAHSMGGHIALRHLHDHPGQIASAALSAPMIHFLPSGARRPIIQVLAWLCAAVAPESYVSPGGRYGDKPFPFEGNPLTSDRLRFERTLAYVEQNPDLALGKPTMAWLRATFRSVATLMAPDYAGAITTPLLMVSASEEAIVDNVAQRQLCALLPHCQQVTIEGARHELMIEADGHRERFWELVDAHFAKTLS